jgi:hypothetical protein
LTSSKPVAAGHSPGYQEFPREKGFGLQVSLLRFAEKRAVGVSIDLAESSQDFLDGWVWALPMDQHTFDRLTRAVATGQSRRVFLRRLFGVGAAAAVAGPTVDDARADQRAIAAAPGSTVPLHEPSEPSAPPAPPAVAQQPEDAICPEPLQSTACGCLDPNTQTCCQDEICTGVCTAADGCCNVSSDINLVARGEVCGEHCCHPHLDPSHVDYSECCDQTCCAGYCYGENLCCAVDRFCPGTVEDRCCGENERCCGADTDVNVCIPAGEGSCCGVDECVADASACYVSCEAGFCRQHICDADAFCCVDSAGVPACVAGNCCSDSDCAAGEACLDAVCTAVECFVDADCSEGDACQVATCMDGACNYAALCAGECATCAEGVCATDDTLCGPCATCDAGICSPVVCPDGFMCYEGTGECLGIA